MLNKFFDRIFLGKIRNQLKQLIYENKSYVQLVNLKLSQLQNSINIYLAKEFIEDGFISIIVLSSEETPFFIKKIEPNLFITNSPEAIYNINNSIISINSEILSIETKQLDHWKLNNNKIIFEIENNSELYKNFIKSGIGDFIVCKDQALTREMQLIFPVDKVLYVPSLNDCKITANNLKRILDLLLYAPSLLGILPKKLVNNTDKFLDVQAEVARNNLASNNLYYRHCEKFYFAPIINWFNNDDMHKKVLDVGCAYGTISIFLSKYFDCKVYATDFMEDYYTANLFQKYNIHFKCSNVEIDEIPYEEKFDIIILTEVLEHFNFFPVPTLKKLANKLTVGGFLIITTPDSIEWGKTTKYYNDLKEIPYPKIQDNYIDDHVWQYDKEELEEVLYLAGLKISLLEYSPGMQGVGRHFCAKVTRL